MSKVINLFDREVEEKKEETEEETMSFEEIMRKNAENKERMRKERAKANKGVVRSYRLKK
jgi:hypothetical protein